MDYSGGHHSADDMMLDEDRAPHHFNIASTHEHDGIHWAGECVLRCPMCQHLRKSFHCRNCVRAGDFVPTHLSRKQQATAVPFSVKQAAFQKVMERHRKITADADVLIQKHKDYETLLFDIELKKKNIALLKQLLRTRQQTLNEAQEKKAKTLKEIEETRRKFPQYENNVKHLQEFVERRTADNRALAAKRTELQSQVQLRIRQRIAALVKYIFPISRVMSRSSSPTDGTASATTAEVARYITELAEATQMSFVDGRWHLQGSQHDEQHIVVAPWLPGNGDYSAYVAWIAANKDCYPLMANHSGPVAAGRVNAMEDVDTLTSINDAYRISAALSYTTQLVDLISYYLDVNVPFKVNYGDFCNKELTEAVFVQKVARLNGNILALCYSQNVKPSVLSATHTLANIQQLLLADDLGRIGAVDVANSKIIDVLQLNADVIGDDSDSDGDDHSFPLEWEAVPHLAAHETVCPPSPPPLSLINTQQTVSMANDLMNNAVASVTSIWRGFTGR